MYRDRDLARWTKSSVRGAKNRCRIRSRIETSASDRSSAANRVLRRWRRCSISVARSSSHSGCRWRIGSYCSFPISKRSALFTARTVAVRRSPVSSAISPNTAPRPIVSTNVSVPRRRRITSTVPSAMTNKESPSVPCTRMRSSGEKHAVYRFQARWVEEWRRGRVLLAGDAAHQTPPFAGQGLCAGMRSRARWPGTGHAAGHVRARVGPHTQALIELAIEMGKLICIADAQEAAARDDALIAAYDGGLTDVPPFPAISEGIVLAGSPSRGPAVLAGGGGARRPAGPVRRRGRCRLALADPLRAGDRRGVGEVVRRIRRPRSRPSTAAQGRSSTCRGPIASGSPITVLPRSCSAPTSQCSAARRRSARSPSSSARSRAPCSAQEIDFRE